MQLRLDIFICIRCSFFLFQCDSKCVCQLINQQESDTCSNFTRHLLPRRLSLAFCIKHGKLVMECFLFSNIGKQKLDTIRRFCCLFRLAIIDVRIETEYTNR